MEICNTKTIDRPEKTNQTATAVEGLRFHFIGAGGVGMSGLAKLLLKNNVIVTGSDQEASPVTAKLGDIGIDIRIGHGAENLGADTDAVVISAAIKEDNPELIRARQKGFKVYKYAQMLGAISGRYDCIAISGTHGKSTTGGWLVHCMKEAGLEPNYIIGADITQLGTNSGVGESRFFVAEACEYDRSFLNIRPKIAAILNIEADHLDYYKDEKQIIEAFREFALGISEGGTLIANSSDPNVAEVLNKLPADLDRETFGFEKSCNYYVENLHLNNNGLYSFDIFYNDQILGVTQINLPGKHNILNALAVTAMAKNAGMEAGQILQLLPKFTGMDRRMMLKGKINDVTILDDYAHHPTEIKASLAAVRQRYQPRRIWCIFQPHQYSRTRFLLDDFAESFKLADVTILPEIYFVRDTQAAKKQVNSQVLVEKICNNGHKALFIDGFAAICDYLKENVLAGDLVITMGAGDIWKVADEYIRWLGKNR